MIICGSANAACGLDAGFEVLASGGTALEAVEVATRIVEDNPGDHSVGTGGYPNLVGVVELDASIMEGSGRRAGAVGALQGFRHPISVARAVMSELPHVLLVGQGAARFAEEIGAETADLSSDEGRAAFVEHVESHLKARSDLDGALAHLARMAADPEHVTGTVNLLSLDRDGHIASAVSTSGWAFKYPGRVGDSPVIGAGNYCDDRYGAACCTGFGELALRCSTARSVVAAMAAGAPVDRAVRLGLEDALTLGGVTTARASLNVVAIDRAGRPAAASTRPGQRFCYRSEEASEVVIAERLTI